MSPTLPKDEVGSATGAEGGVGGLGGASGIGGLGGDAGGGEDGGNVKPTEAPVPGPGRSNGMPGGGGGDVGNGVSGGGGGGHVGGAGQTHDEYAYRSPAQQTQPALTSNPVASHVCDTPVL